MPATTGRQPVKIGVRYSDCAVTARKYKEGVYGKVHAPTAESEGNRLGERRYFRAYERSQGHGEICIFIS